MCLSAIALDPTHPRFTFVVAANRDEFHARPAAALAWWPDRPGILAGRDLQAGGSWLGLSRDGRFALLTNVRGATADRGPSRGTLVPDWLQGDGDVHHFWSVQRGHAAYNLIAADFARGECWWMNPELPAPQRMAAGLHAVSNARLDTPWPKLRLLKHRVADAMAACDDAQQLSQRLFAALADDAPADDTELPHTGVPLDVERALSAAFIRMPQHAYGTRCSTVVIGDASGNTQVWERSYTSDGIPAATRHEMLVGWPPQTSARTISTCGMPASSNGAPRSANPARA